jgi:hypothetical protein
MLVSSSSFSSGYKEKLLAIAGQIGKGFSCSVILNKGSRWDFKDEILAVLAGPGFTPARLTVWCPEGLP